MLTNFTFVQNFARELIQPKPCYYSAVDIWKNIHDKSSYHYQAASFQIPNERNVLLHLIQPNLPFCYSSTCIVYLHGLASFCAEGVFLVQSLNEYFSDLNVGLCLYDLRGHGKDKASSITFGIKESKQLYQLLIYLKEQRKYQRFVLWGRSMGATTILKMVTDFKIELIQKKIVISDLILDSAFYSIQKVAIEIISRKSGLPQLFSKPIFQYLISTIEKLYHLKLSVEIQNFEGVQSNAIFLYSEIDQIVLSYHSKILFQKYPGQKEKILLHVGHNDKRPDDVLAQIYHKIRVRLRAEQSLLGKISISLKKGGLLITKNNCIKAAENNKSISRGFEKYYESQTLKENFQTEKKKKKIELFLLSSKQNIQSQCFNTNLINTVLKPDIIFRQNIHQSKNEKKLINLNGSNKKSPKFQKQNINTVNSEQIGNSNKKQKGLELIQNDKPCYLQLQLNQIQNIKQTSLHQQLQGKKSQVFIKLDNFFKKKQEDQTFHQDKFKQFKSVLLRSNQETKKNLSQNLKNLQFKEKNNQEQIQKKILMNQAKRLNNQNFSTPTSYKEINSYIQKKNLAQNKLNSNPSASENTCTPRSSENLISLKGIGKQLNKLSKLEKSQIGFPIQNNYCQKNHEKVATPIFSNFSQQKI